MVSIPLNLVTVIPHFLYIFAFGISLPLVGASPSPSSPISPEDFCNYTMYPNYCKSVLPNSKLANVYDFGRFFMNESLSQSQQFLDMVNKYLSKYAPNLSTGAVGALEDCQMLTELNIDFLENSFKTINSTSQTLPILQADDVQTLLSAILTNLETCLDGLQETDSSWDGLSDPLFTDTKLYSISLAFVTKGWVPFNKSSQNSWQHFNKLLPFGDGSLPVNISSQANETVQGRRRLLQTADGVDVLVGEYVTVKQDGTGNFTTVKDAIQVAPTNYNGTSGYFLIYVAAGVYEECVVVPKRKTYLLMVGDGINQTIITGNRSVGDGWTTFNSATFAVGAPNFVAVGITFRNTAGAVQGQAVAVRNAADLSAFYSCRFEGYQDTLYAHSMRQFYSECDIYGTVDYIFGNAAVVFQNCKFYVRLPLVQQFNIITAQGRSDPNQNTGISIKDCKITPTEELASSNSKVHTFLGRPWKQYSRTVIMKSFIDGFIDPAGWHAWKGDFALNTSYFAEYKNFGPGSKTTHRVTWAGYHVINSTDAKNFTVSNFLLGDYWLPETGVPYNGGL